MIIDSHCHLDNEKIQHRIKDIINSANKSNVKYMLTICTDNLSFGKILNILKSYENVYGTYGIHPHETNKHRELTIEKIKKQLFTIRPLGFVCFQPFFFWGKARFSYSSGTGGRPRLDSAGHGRHTS